MKLDKVGTTSTSIVQVVWICPLDITWQTGLVSCVAKLVTEVLMYWLVTHSGGIARDMKITA